MNGAHFAALLCSLFLFSCTPLLATASAEKEKITTYEPQNCKYHPLPNSLDSLGFLDYNGETYISDVFGFPSRDATHTILFDMDDKAVITTSIEVPKESLYNIDFYIYEKPSFYSSEKTLIAKASSTHGAAGENSKTYLTKEIGALRTRKVFALELKSTQENLSISSTTEQCLPIRLDLAIVTQTRILNHIPSNCPSKSRMPSSSSEPISISDTPFSLSSTISSPFLYNYSTQPVTTAYKTSIWSQFFHTPHRMNRFLHIQSSLSYRFLTSPLDILVELYMPGEALRPTDPYPTCPSGCISATKVHNGLFMDHSLPSGFTYRLWLLSGEPIHLEEESTQCIQFDWTLSLSLQEKAASFEMKERQWSCQAPRLPEKVVLMDVRSSREVLDGVIQGRNVALSGDFLLPLGIKETENVDQLILLEVHELSLLKVEIGGEILMKMFLSLLSDPGRSLCDAAQFEEGERKKGEVIHCFLEPGSYVLGLYGVLPAQGVSMCSTFHFQFSLRALSLLPQNAICPQGEKLPPSFIYWGEMEAPQGVVIENSTGVRKERWRNFLVSLPTVTGQSSFVSLGSREFRIPSESDGISYFLRVQLQSPFSYGEVYFTVRKGGKIISSPSDNSHFTADFLGPLSPGVYSIEFSYVSLSSTQKFPKKNWDLEKWVKNNPICSEIELEMELVAKDSRKNLTSEDLWLCNASTARFPSLLHLDEGETILLSDSFVFPKKSTSSPPSPNSYTRLEIAEPSFMTLRLNNSVEWDVSVKTINKDGSLSPLPPSTVSVQGGRAFAQLSKGNYALLMAPISPPSPCLPLSSHLTILPIESTPDCPWATHTSRDGIPPRPGKTVIKNNVSPLFDGFHVQLLSHSPAPMPPQVVWLSPSVQQTIHLQIPHKNTSLRLEFEFHPMWLPIDVTLVKKSEKKNSLSPFSIQAIPDQSRLLIFHQNLEQGDYELLFSPFPNLTKSLDVMEHCSHVRVSMDSGEINSLLSHSLRAELMSTPALLPTVILPRSLNLVGLYSHPLTSFLGTLVLEIERGNSLTHLRVEEDTVLRIMTETLELNAPFPFIGVINDSLGEVVGEMSPFFIKGGKGDETRGEREWQLLEERFREKKIRPEEYYVISNNSGGLSTILKKGRYFLVFESHYPILTTIGISSVKTQIQDNALARTYRKTELGAATSDCMKKLPSFEAIVEDYLSSQWKASQDPSSPGAVDKDVFLHIFMEQPEGNKIVEFPIDIPVPVNLHLEAASNFFLDNVRVAVLVPEGKWIGEQRSSLNSLRLQLSPGRYQVLIERLPNENYSALPSDLQKNRCVSFSFRLDVSLLTTGSSPSSTFSCPSQGALPLPLDYTSINGGSVPLEGPMNTETSRLVSRGKVLLSELHDGRKKFFLKKTRQHKDVVIKILISSLLSTPLFSSPPVSSLLSPRHPVDFEVLHSSKALDPLVSYEQYSQSSIERVYRLPPDVSGVWVQFKAFHNGKTKPCHSINYALLVEPIESLLALSKCPGARERERNAYHLKDGDSVQVLADITDLIPKDMDPLRRGERELHFSPPPFLLKEKKEGYMTETRFQVTELSHLSYLVSFNGILSHIETDLSVQQTSGTFGEYVRLAEGVLEWVNDSGAALNTARRIVRILPPGSYRLRIANDLAPLFFEGGVSERCFPYQIEVHLRPIYLLSSLEERLKNEVASASLPGVVRKQGEERKEDDKRGSGNVDSNPSIIFVTPATSLPVNAMTDFLFTIQFSSPPAAGETEIHNLIYFTVVPTSSSHSSLSTLTSLTSSGGKQEDRRIYFDTHALDKTNNLLHGRISSEKLVRVGERSIQLQVESSLVSSLGPPHQPAFRLPIEGATFHICLRLYNNYRNNKVMVYIPPWNPETANGFDSGERVVSNISPAQLTKGTEEDKKKDSLDEGRTNVGDVRISTSPISSVSSHGSDSLDLKSPQEDNGEQGDEKKNEHLCREGERFDENTFQCLPTVKPKESVTKRFYLLIAAVMLAYGGIWALQQWKKKRLSKKNSQKKFDDDFFEETDRILTQQEMRNYMRHRDYDL